MTFKVGSKIRLILLLGFGFLMARGQNLVVNPSFEQFSQCPEAPSNMTNDVEEWSIPTRGTTDYFNICSKAMGVPNNFNGEQTAEFGKGYAGLYMMAPNNYREYLQAHLKETLIKGKRYAISFYISLAEKSSYAIGDIGLLFTQDKMKSSTNEVIKLQGSGLEKGNYNYARISNSGFYADKKGWMRVYKEIVAKGTENYLIIGNFQNNANTELITTGESKKASYYYLDMVSVSPLENEPFFDDLEQDKIYVLRDVLFPTDEYLLNKRAKRSLKDLYTSLKQDPLLSITIHAHTDNEGSNDYNKDLSQKRAKAVAAYLTSLGLAGHRIEWQGHGGSKPVADNGSVEGRRKNRRAEFKISKISLIDRPSLTGNVFEEDND
ncbi:MAG: OmpA family protein [Bacteroidota bacterium]